MKRIESIGGSIEYATSLHRIGGSQRSDSLSKSGVDAFFNDVTTVNLSDTSVTDDDLRSIAGIRSIKTICLAGTKVNDASLEPLKRLNLIELHLERTNVNGGCLRLLQMQQGCRVYLDDSLANDECLQYLRNSSQIVLDGTKVTSAGIEYLKGSSRLERLSLQRTPVDDSAITVLEQLSTLRDLNVSKTAISGQGLFKMRNMLPQCRLSGDYLDLSYLGEMPANLVATLKSPPIRSSSERSAVKLLILSDSRIHDGHLAVAELYSELEVLDVRKSSVSDSGLSDLKQKNPKLIVYR